VSTSLTHAFVGGTLSLYGDVPVSRPKLAVTLAVLAVIPDIDALSIPLGLSHDHLLGHRGFTHSLVFAAIVGQLVLAVLFRKVPRFSRDWWTLWGLFFLATASHGILDALTYMASGVALWAPFDATRYGFPWRPLPPPPLAVGRIQGYFAPGLMLAEFSKVWLPVGAIAALFWGLKRLRFHLPGSARPLSDSDSPNRRGNEAARSKPGTQPSRGFPLVVSLACIGVILLPAFLEPESTHAIIGATISYRGVSPEEAAAMVADMRKLIERRHEEVLSSALLRWSGAIDKEPAFRHRILPDTDDPPLTGGGTAWGDLSVPLEYRFRVRQVSQRPDESESAGIAFDVEVEFQVPDKHASTARVMQELIRDRLFLLFCHELDALGGRRGATLTLSNWSDRALVILPAQVGARKSTGPGMPRTEEGSGIR
jgi:inner membrane protein